MEVSQISQEMLCILWHSLKKLGETMGFNVKDVLSNLLDKGGINSNDLADDENLVIEDATS